MKMFESRCKTCGRKEGYIRGFLTDSPESGCKYFCNPKKMEPYIKEEK